MKNEILRILKESEEYISGQELCEKFQVSRTAVWKVIEQLKKEGYHVEAVRNRGYRLIESPDILSEAEIRSCLNTRWAGNAITCFEKTDSTNDRAKEAGRKGAHHGQLFVADMQSAGKGRRGRSWNSPEGTSIYMSLLLRPDIHPVKAPMLTLVMGLSVAEGILKSTGIEPGIKWPNDIVVNGKKVCGILTEMAAEIDCVDYIVIGCGINVNQTEFPEDIKDRASSLRIEGERRYVRSEIIASVLERFEENYSIFMKHGDLSGLLQQYHAVLVNRNREVRVIEPGHEYEACAEGINETGELLVTLPDGEKRKIFAGEVSVRGIFGYV